MNEFIEIQGARIHNLKEINVKIPRNKLTVITGVSGSGKSSLAFDTLYEEGKRRYLMFSGTSFLVDSIPTFDRMTGLSPTVAVEQRMIRQSNPRSTVGTRTKLGSLLAILFAQYGERAPEYEDGIPLAMEMFQRNSAKGMCVQCLGSGVSVKVKEAPLMADRDKAIRDILPERVLMRGGTGRRFRDYCTHHKINVDLPLHSLDEETLDLLFYGDGGETLFGGIVPWLLSIGKNKDISGRQRWLLSQAGILHKGSCPKCNGSGLGEQAAHTWIAGRTISELEQIPINELGEFLKSAEIKPSQLLTEVMTKLDCLMDVGLHHLALARSIPTLSGGELQRLFLASTIIADMDSMIFVFDEPTIGLHEIEKQKLMDIIKGLVKRGNTVVAVEHDATFMRCADYLIDLGPDAGVYGGEKIFEGMYEEFLGCRASKTAPYLTSESERDIRAEFRPVVNAKKLRIENASRHNLQQVTVEFPLGVMVGIAGVSGSGKSSLLSDTLVPKVKEVLHPKEEDDEEDGDDEEDSGVRLYGTEYLNKCLVIDQKPIGRSRTSCPATYTVMFDRVRALYTKESGLPAGRFSVNAEGGCIFCKGEGVVHYPVGFGQYVDVECDSCGGSGFTAEAMQVKVDGQTIRDILAMTVDEAAAFFQGKDKQIGSMLTTLQRVGMGYLTLGQKTPTISGGESQRIKLAKELAKGVNAKDCLYVLDEPTTGLSFSDSRKLMNLLQELVDKGGTVLVTEHDPYVLSQCDHLIELGPGGGSDGGFVIATGSPADLKQNENSVIGRYLR